MEDVKGGAEQTPRGLNDQWQLTPSLLDPNSMPFAAAANHPPTYYPSTPGGLGIPYHSQAGDLHTPRPNMGIVSQLVIHPTTAADPHVIHPAIDPNSFHNPFAPHAPSRADGFVHPTTIAPNSFLHRDPAYDTLDNSIEHSPIDSLAVNGSSTNGSLIGFRQSTSEVADHQNEEDNGMDQFRFHVTLKEATAMKKENTDNPITYLNKGQAYTVIVADTAPMASARPIEYRTYIRVSFEEQEQRSKSAACWQLWKEGRGSNEAHHRDGKLLAVEHVDPNQGGDGETRHSQVQLEFARFDGFCVQWTPNPVTGLHECAISVRFNFLSTDFSHSKGVKGIPLRLCAKTEVSSIGNIDGPPDNHFEVAYCMVKLFRDHGAERKLSNDSLHVKKLIQKLSQQLIQIKNGDGLPDKRKRNGSIVKGAAPKSLKHKRTNSIDSQNDSGRPRAEEDIQLKLDLLKAQTHSRRPVSLFNLQGDQEDDPDRYPIFLDDGLTHQLSWESTGTNGDTESSTSHIISPTTSTHSLSSSHRSIDPHNNSAYYQSSLYDSGDRHDSVDWASVSQQDTDSQVARLTQSHILHYPVKVQKVSHEGSNMSDDWIEAMDVDVAYQPPAVPKKPTTCFYVRIRRAPGQKSQDYHHAVYLTERTAQDLIHAISRKCRFDPSRIVRALCARKDGVNIVMDDDVVRELPEGQDMVVEFSELRDSSMDSSMEGSDSSNGSPSAAGVEVKVIF
ncbi:hypothetical protein AJ80_04324 [Polytolypa hystricis UAMH7299]|uniref:Grh/CP2 DB domain-containing protein n=1 Tax=Polytolypa hystricis (strain UAMH7299) TaxID=1447883 RepID=A0A2B7YCB1_POLH7|nr:hypothetical protein AJ80_04324 [Polytolypa hystricis UAMH7299]